MSVDNTTPGSKESAVVAQLRSFQSKMRDMDALEDRMHKRLARARRRILLHEQTYSALRSSHLRVFVSHSYTPELTKAGAMAALMQGKDVKPSPAIWRLHVEGKLIVDFLNAKTPKEVGNGDDEEEVNDRLVQPVKFTHMFDKIMVSFQTIFETLPVSNPPSKKKKSSRRSSGASKTVAPPKQEETQKSVSSCQQLDIACKNHSETDMWTFEYLQPPSPEPANKWRVHSVVAKIDLYRRYRYPGPPGSNVQVVACDGRYRILSSALQKGLFPHHGPETVDLLTGKRRNYSQPQVAEIPAHNEVHIPSTLSMQEISMAFFTYIHDRSLVSPQDKTLVLADKLLQDLLGMEQFPFSQLQHLLLSKNLIAPLGREQQIEDPVRVTYLMDSASGCTLGRAPVDDSSSILQFDCDIMVPNLLGARLRHLLRRVKSREVAYATARAKHAKLRPSGTPAQLLANIAPEGEVRTEAEIDARIDYLLQQLQESAHRAIRTRAVVNQKIAALTK